MHGMKRPEVHRITIAFSAACVEKEVQTDEMSSKLPHALSIKVNTKEPYFPGLHADGSFQIAGWVFLYPPLNGRRCHCGQEPTKVDGRLSTNTTCHTDDRPRDTAGPFRIDDK